MDDHNGYKWILQINFYSYIFFRARLFFTANCVLRINEMAESNEVASSMVAPSSMSVASSAYDIEYFARKFETEFPRADHSMLSNKKILDELKAEHYDVAISEFYDVCIFGVFHQLGIKTKLASMAIAFENWAGSPFGIYGVSSYVTNLWAASINGPKMTFLERFCNFYYDIYIEYYINRLRFSLLQPLFYEAFGDDFPLLGDISRNLSLLFINSRPFYDLPRHISNKVVYIGGIVEPKPAGLTKDFEKVFEQAKDGVIFLSFGTFANPDTMPYGIKQALVKVFATFPSYEFVWKFKLNENDRMLFKSSSNLHMFDWVDQTAILAHPKTRAFVTHCGWNSLNEAARAGMPTVGIPLLGDQMYNAAVMKHKRVGVYVKVSEVVPTAGGVIIDALHKVLYNDEYRTNVRLVQQKLQSEPFPAKDRLVKWVEFAAHFPELNELNLPTVDDLGILAYYSLDVIFVTTAVIILVVICVILFMRFVIRKIVELLSVKQKIKVH
ncbi:UDP-glucoronosyl and UDP-glucosyl transferase domain-containing protein [Ditylenchus destructor]|nr:UDP-glucoronosyl and UDP-glucosyl transferase domain-containing protein [Ditylenchus destructor]